MQNRLRQVAPVGLVSWKMLAGKCWIVVGLVIGGVLGYDFVAIYLEPTRAWAVSHPANAAFLDEVLFHHYYKAGGRWELSVVASAVVIGSLIGAFAFGLSIILYLRLKTWFNKTKADRTAP